MLLVGPAGQNLVLMSDVPAPGGFAVNNAHPDVRRRRRRHHPEHGDRSATGTYRPSEQQRRLRRHLPGPRAGSLVGHGSLRVQREQPQRHLAAVCRRRHQRRHRLHRWRLVDHGHHSCGRAARRTAVHERRLPRRRGPGDDPVDPRTGGRQRRRGVGDRCPPAPRRPRHPESTSPRSTRRSASPTGRPRHRSRSPSSTTPPSRASTRRSPCRCPDRAAEPHSAVRAPPS